MNNIDKLEKLMQPIDQQIMMCDDRNDVLLLACGMLTTVKAIFDDQLGVEGRKTMFEDYVK
jgi:hypothetical protein